MIDLCSLTSQWTEISLQVIGENFVLVSYIFIHDLHPHFGVVLLVPHFQAK